MDSPLPKFSVRSAQASHLLAVFAGVFLLLYFATPHLLFAPYAWTRPHGKWAEAISTALLRPHAALYFRVEAYQHYVDWQALALRRAGLIPSYD